MPIGSIRHQVEELACRFRFLPVRHAAKEREPERGGQGPAFGVCSAGGVCLLNEL